ncbi:MAG TPA: hypothetical protein VFZ79_14040 [Acidimicrobiales bacterium]
MLLVSVVVVLVSALGDGPAARRRRIATGSVLAVACALGAASVGIVLLPAAVALLTAGLKPRRSSTPPSLRALAPGQYASRNMMLMRGPAKAHLGKK